MFFVGDRSLGIKTVNFGHHKSTSLDWLQANKLKHMTVDRMLIDAYGIW